MSSISILSKPPILFQGRRNQKHSITNSLLIVISKIITPNRRTKYNGPNVVFNNLKKGLKILNQSVLVNPSVYTISSNVGVLSNLDALDWAINAKKQQKIRRLVAGPNLVTLPHEMNGILLSPFIDVVVTPCQWVKDLYISQAPLLKEKIKIWPVGIDANYWKPSDIKEKTNIIIYNKIKNDKEKVFQRITNELEKRGINFQVINYGLYNPKEYLAALHDAKGLVFLSRSESQGIALFEAWSCNVPTLIWDQEYWESDDGLTKWSNASSAPFFDQQCGIKMKSISEFPNKLDKFLEEIDLFAPRHYILENFTLEICAQNYIDLFSS